MLSIAEVVREPNIVILSPHYDDVPLIFGGYLDQLAKQGLLSQKQIRIVNFFSRSNYVVRDDAGNSDTSLKRIQYATGVRLLEDLNCLDDLLGRGHYVYELRGEPECVVRGKGWKPGEKFEFPQGNKATFDWQDWEIFERIKAYVRDLVSQDHTALLVPLGMKEHIDHIILRDALIDSRKEIEKAAKATIYFGEDQPYSGLASEQDWATANAVIAKLGLRPLDYEIDIRRKESLIMIHYPSQVEESYREGLLNRAKQLADKLHTPSGAERTYKWA